MKIYIDEAIMITDLTFSGAEEIGVDEATGLAVLPESLPVLVLMRQKRSRDQGMRYYYAAHPPLLAEEAEATLSEILWRAPRSGEGAP